MREPVCYGQHMDDPQTFPPAIEPERVGSFPALTKSGGGYFYDDVLEYRVWCHPADGAPEEATGDYYYAFATYEDALACAKTTPGAREPLALVRQLEHVDEPEPGVYVHVRGERITEWRVEWLAGSKRNEASIPDMLARGRP